MTGAEIVLKWMQKYHKTHGTPPTYSEITSQLEMAIEEEHIQENSPPIIEKALQDGIDWGLSCCGISTGTQEANFKEAWMKKNMVNQKSE